MLSKVLCVLYPDPVTGYPPEYARDGLPELPETYPDSDQTLPSPSKQWFEPGSLLGSVSGELGLREFLESQGHEFVVTSDKEGKDSEFEKHLPDADVVISQPFWPAYLPEERIRKAKNLKLVLTAGIGSDHVDTDAAANAGITVAEITYSNSVSVAEHAVMQILDLVRNFVPSHQYAVNGGWNIADCVKRAYDLEGMDVGIIAAGRIGLALARRLKPFGVHLSYFKRHRLSEELEQELGLTYYESTEELVRNVDVVSIHSPLTDETRHLFDEELMNSMRRGSYIVNTARAEIMVRDDLIKVLESGQIAGYAGDVWYPQPAPVEHPWRRMPNEAMTPHISGATLSAQTRIADGVVECLEDFFRDERLRDEYIMAEPES
ncbi:NAD-dependent formate dehydrogenase [Curtobacterium sp. S6]|uniref:NAD-dependent formate dehydrogenase n=1 Tax=Curtobacterium sp. S6 TaxID=1479623 RepID=UPI0009E96E22|nr:NAD-dependent formate dehydrogenase [Curtobacterium sp. S6]